MDECVRVCVSLGKSRLLFITGEYKSLVLDCSEGSANSLPRYKHAAAITFTYRHALKDSARFRTCPQTMAEKKLKSSPVISLPHYTISNPFSLKGILWGCHTTGHMDRIQHIPIFFLFIMKDLCCYIHITLGIPGIIL